MEALVGEAANEGVDDDSPQEGTEHGPLRTSALDVVEMSMVWVNNGNSAMSEVVGNPMVKPTVDVMSAKLGKQLRMPHVVESSHNINKKYHGVRFRGGRDQI